MANKTLFKSLIGKLVPATDAINEERAPAYAVSPKHQLAQYAATGCLNTTFYAGADEQLAKVLESCVRYRGILQIEALQAGQVLQAGQPIVVGLGTPHPQVLEKP